MGKFCNLKNVIINRDKYVSQKYRSGSWCCQNTSQFIIFFISPKNNTTVRYRTVQIVQWENSPIFTTNGYKSTISEVISRVSYMMVLYSHHCNTDTLLSNMYFSNFYTEFVRYRTCTVTSKYHFILLSVKPSSEHWHTRI